MWATVAASIAVVAGIGLLAQRTSPTTITTATTTGDGAACTPIAPALEAGIVAWGSIEDWSLATNSSPDLAELALDRIDALPSDTTADLRSDLAVIVAESPTATPDQSARRATVVREAISVLVVEAAADSGYCPSPILEAAADDPGG